MRRAIAAAITLALAACGTIVALSARDKLLGMSAPDLVACLGVPDPAKVMRTKPDTLVAEWDTQAPTAAEATLNGVEVTLPLGLSVKWSHPSVTCHVQATILRDGTVAAVSLNGGSAVAGDDGACGPMVAECTHHPDDTGLPPGYDAFAYFLKPIEVVRKP